MNANVKAGSEDEWFDVVNQRDEVIGKELRAVVHAKGLWHRAVHVVAWNANGQVFLQKRSLTKDVSPGLWTVACSGHVDSGEAYDVAAQRELREELGLSLPAPPQRWFRVEACAETGWEFLWCYRIETEGPFTLHPTEIEAGRWVSLAALAGELREKPGKFCPAFHHLWKTAAEKLSGGPDPHVAP